MAITHSKVSAVADGADTTVCRPSDWNADHTIADETITAVMMAVSSVDLATDTVTGILPTANGGTGIAYFTAAGPTVARVYTFPDAAATILYSGGALGTPASGVLTNTTGLPVSGLANGTDGELITWSAAGVAATVAVGMATHVLTSNGVGVAPTFQAIPAASVAWGAITGTLSAQTDLQTVLDTKLSSVAAAWPIGSVFISVVSTNPNTLLGFGTWSAIAAGRVLVGLDSGDTDFDTAEETGGAKTVTLDTTMIPAHTHTQDAHTHTQDSHNHTQNVHSHTQASTTTSTGTGSNRLGTVDTSSTAVNTGNATATNQAATATNQNATATNQNTGGGAAHPNVQPYFVVYMFKRTA